MAGISEDQDVRARAIGVPSDAEIEPEVPATEIAPAAPRRIGPKAAAAVAYVTAMFLGGMDNHIVNVALPTLSREFHASVSAVQWTVIAYVLSLALWIPASGWIGDKLGTKRTFLLALGIFTVASALCGQARNLPELIICRALQGAGGGMTTPVATAMLWRAYPPVERARVLRIAMAPMLIAPAIAPIVGGVMIEHLSWRWIFYVNVPVGAVAIYIAARNLVEYAPGSDSRFDLRGFLLSGVGLTLLLYGLSEGSYRGWGSPEILSTALTGAILISFFIRAELRDADPMLRVRLLGDRLFRATNLVSTLAASSLLGVLYLTPIYLQVALHESPVRAGLTVFVEAIGIVLNTQTTARLFHRVGPRRLALTGTTLLAFVILAISRVDAATNPWEIRALMFAVGFTTSMSMFPTMTAMFSNIARNDIGHAAAISNTARQVGLAFAVAIITTVVAAFGGTSVRAFQHGFLVALVLAILAFCATWIFVHDEDAAASLGRKDEPAIEGEAAVELESI